MDKPLAALLCWLAIVVGLTTCTPGPSADDRLAFANDLGRALAVEDGAEASTVSRGATSCDAAKLEGRSDRVGEGLAALLERAGFATSDGGGGVTVQRSEMVATVASNGSQVFITVVDKGC